MDTMTIRTLSDCSKIAATAAAHENLTLGMARLHMEFPNLEYRGGEKRLGFTEVDGHLYLSAIAAAEAAGWKQECSGMVDGIEFVQFYAYPETRTHAEARENQDFLAEAGVENSF